MIIKIQLTDRQREMLSPLYDEMMKASSEGMPGVLLGQLTSRWSTRPDVIHFRFIDEKTTKRMKDAKDEKAT